MEIIDIWHFILSQLLLEGQGDQEAALSVLMREIRRAGHDTVLSFDGRQYDVSAMPILDKLQLLSATAATGRTEIPLFAAILTDCGLDWEELFRQYTGKNVLNVFRQDHGYKEGRYNKTWQGREDNEHLVELMADLDSPPSRYHHDLYQALKSRYMAA